MQLGCSPRCSVDMPDWGMWPEDSPDWPVDTGWSEGKPDCTLVPQGMCQLGKHCLPAVTESLLGTSRLHDRGILDVLHSRKGLST